ncbi:hypothetical protein [Candidatus Stoquefichus massiliensis]|uniref:hypothetical protein n=1 Tax=Candidatus Stoquefichus massiliensis TaxID=1470350 RepID=UPI000486CF65|nr:hypothetical protein [Candidatus Stoquefichus massiliensis]
MKDKGYFAILLSMILIFVFASPVSASNTVYDQENREVQPRAPMYIHRYTYEPSSTSRYNQYRNVGTVSLDNTGSSVQSYLGFKVQSSGTVNISVGISGSVQAQVDALFAKVKASTSASLTTSRSYTKGTSYATSFYVPARKNGSITGYIPAMKTSGRMKDQLIDANTADFYVISTSYITVNTSYVPLKDDMHFVNKTW